MGDSVVKNSAFNFINTAFKLSERVGGVYESESDSGAFEQMIESVGRDLEEVERLLLLESVKVGLVNTPGRLSYIQGIVINAKTALHEIGSVTDGVRSQNGEAERMPFENRSRWMFNDHGKLVNQDLQLSTCQQDLSSLLALLASLDQPHFTSAQSSFQKEFTTPDPDVSVSLEDLISPWQRRKMSREAGRGSKELSRDSTKQVPLPAPASQVESILPRRPLRVPRKKVGSGQSGHRSPEEQPPPLSSRRVKSEPEVSHTTMNEPNHSSTPQIPDIPNSYNPASSEMSKAARPSISISSMSSEIYSAERNLISRVSVREKSPGITEVIETRTHASNQTNIIPSPPSKPPRTIQILPSKNMSPTLYMAQEEKRISHTRPFQSSNNPPPPPQLQSMGYLPVFMPSIQPNPTHLSTQTSKSHTRNHSAALTSLPVPSYPSLRQRSLGATNLLGPINHFEYTPDSGPSSPELEQSAPTTLQAPVQKSTRAESMSGSQHDRNSATELLGAQSKMGNSLDVPKTTPRKPKSFNRTMELPTDTTSLPAVKGWDLRIPSVTEGKAGKNKTVAEGRRRNRRALMELMEQGSCG